MSNGRRSPHGRPRTPIQNSYGTLNPNSVNEYEEFFGGAMSCPTCNGAGTIGREQETELVALIPLRDSRLKPRRTVLYVFLAVLFCVFLGGLILFFLFPRSVQLTTKTSGNMHPDRIYINETGEGIVLMEITNIYNVSNDNFFPVTINKMSLTVLFDQKVVGQASNTTSLKVPLKSVGRYHITVNLTFIDDEGYIAYYCQQSAKWGHTLLMPFQATAISSIWGKTEENSLMSYQHVKCTASPNDTSKAFFEDFW